MRLTNKNQEGKALEEIIKANFCETKPNSIVGCPYVVKTWCPKNCNYAKKYMEKGKYWTRWLRKITQMGNKMFYIYMVAGIFGGIVIEFINNIYGGTAGIGVLVYILMILMYLKFNEISQKSEKLKQDEK